jgi:hypothetical protein
LLVTTDVGRGLLQSAAHGRNWFIVLKPFGRARSKWHKDKVDVVDTLVAKASHRECSLDINHALVLD